MEVDMNMHPSRYYKKIYNALPFVILVAVWAVMPVFVSTLFWTNVFILVFVRIIGAVSLRTIMLSGSTSFAHGAFVGIGAYTAAILANNLGLPAYLTIPLGGLFTLIVGVITGIPFVRLRSVYYIMASMFLGITVVYIISALKITEGLYGISYIPGFLKGIQKYYYFFLALTVVCCAIMYRFEFSRIGVTLRAVAQSNDAAAAMGVNCASFKLMAIGLGSFFAGISGAAYAHYNASLSPASFTLNQTLVYIMYVMVGGRNKFLGPILGAIILVVTPQLSRAMGQWSPFATVAVMIIIAYLLPGGLVSIPETIKNAISKRRDKLEVTAVPTIGEGGE